jgi:predicted transcriptional regulator
VDAIHKRLAVNVRARAKALGVPLTHIADRAGVSRANMWSVLKGEVSPTLAWLAKIAGALECEVSDLTATNERLSALVKTRKGRR